MPHDLPRLRLPSYFVHAGNDSRSGVFTDGISGYVVESSGLGVSRMMWAGYVTRDTPGVVLQNGGYVRKHV